MAGALGSTASALPAAARVVGDDFVNQYYNVLYQSPQNVHRFYTDASRLTRAEAGADGLVDTAVSESEFYRKLMFSTYGDFQAEIVSVESQHSLTGGVLVMVTGALTSKSSGRRNFVQSFLLAPQATGFFVLNDIFRYLDGELQPEISKQSPIHSNGIPELTQIHVISEPKPSLIFEHDVREISAQEVEATVEEISEPLVQRVDVSETEDDGKVVSRMETTSITDEPSSPIAVPSVPSLEAISEEAPEQSSASVVTYASMLRKKQNGGPLVPSTNCNSVPKATASATERRAPSQQNRTTITTTGQDRPPEGAVTKNEVDARSVFVRNLPTTITASRLEEEFGKFGVVKPGEVSVKSPNQAVCFAILEFEEVASAQTAIESSPISISGRRVYIEQKRSTGRLYRPGQADRLFPSDGFRGPARSTGLGSAGRASRPEIPSRGRGTGPAPGRSGNFGSGSSNDGSSSGSTDAAASGVARGTGPAPGRSSNSGSGSSNNGSSSGSTDATASGADNNHRDVQGGNRNRASKRRGNQIPKNGAVLQ